MLFKKTRYFFCALGLGLGVSCATPPGPDIRAAAGLANAVQFRAEALPTDAPPIGNALDLPAAIERAVRQSPTLQAALAERQRPTVLDVVVTRDPARMLPAVDNRAVTVEQGDRIA